jgi:hypothetical protein
MVLAVYSCKRTTVVDAANYIRYADNPGNGLVKEYSDAEKSLKITAQLKSPEYLAIKESDPGSFRPDSILLLAKEFEGGYHFGFTISSTTPGYDAIKGKLSPQEYLKRITYMSGEIKNDFKLVAGIDTIPCSVCHYERTYNVSPDNIIMLVFAYDKAVDEDLLLIYDDKIFGINRIEFGFKNKDIKNAPKLL